MEEATGLSVAGSTAVHQLIARIRSLLGGYPSPRFSLCGLLAPQERDLNRLLAVLFDPHGAHAQGDFYLRRLLRRINHPAAEQSTIQATVQVDAPVLGHGSKTGLVDIRITIAQHGPILIENKPWAAEQDHQLETYAKAVGDGRLVFMPARASRKPTSIKPETRERLGKKFVVLPYADNPSADDPQSELGLISLIAGDAGVGDDAFRHTMVDVARHLRREVLYEREEEAGDARTLAMHLTDADDRATALRFARAWPKARGIHLERNLKLFATQVLRQSAGLGTQLELGICGEAVHGGGQAGLLAWPEQILKLGEVEAGNLIYYIEFSASSWNKVYALRPQITLRTEAAAKDWTQVKTGLFCKGWQPNSQTEDDQAVAANGAAIGDLASSLSECWAPSPLNRINWWPSFVTLTPRNDLLCGPQVEEELCKLASQIAQLAAHITGKLPSR